MRDTINLMQHHTSVRNFMPEPLPESVKNQLVSAAQSGSSSNFIQATSIIEVTDLKTREKIAKISNSDAYVKQSGAFFVFIADLYRQANILKQAQLPLDGIQNMESLLVGVIDTAIAGENMAIAAESLDLGICFIGGIRNEMDSIKELLGLPKYTVPLFGMTVGIPVQKNEIKPRLPKKNISFKNRYEPSVAVNLDSYNQQTREYYANRSTAPQNTDWSHKMLHFFAEPKRPAVAEFLKKQGFSLE